MTIETQHREIMLDLRLYFASKSVAAFSRDTKQRMEAIQKEAEIEKKLLKACEAFTAKEQAELPFG